MLHIFKMVLVFSLSINSHASTLILEEIQKSIIQDFKLEGKVKPLEEIHSTTVKKQLSKGEQIVEEQLRKNREKIKKMQAEENKLEAIESKELRANEWQKSKIQEVDNWQEEKQKIINEWIAEKEKFNQRIPEYKEDLMSENSFKEFQTAATNKNIKEVKMPVFPDYYVIEKALDLEIKDQGHRPTCASFTGIRAAEILMAQQGKNEKLSEQYFFWASLPKCQTSPCKKEGSWVYNGYQKSVEVNLPNIPLNKNCPYNAGPINDNVTQIPLANGCHSGYAKIKKFSVIQTFPEIVTAIKKGHPVIGGFKLSENFYKNNGYVFEHSIKEISTKLDDHADGHAILLIGIMKLPTELQQNEGMYCLISANSWGVGWGKGGHACLSEKWLLKHRFDIPFVALEEIETI